MANSSNPVLDSCLTVLRLVLLLVLHCRLLNICWLECGIGRLHFLVIVQFSNQFYHFYPRIP